MRKTHAQFRVFKCLQCGSTSVYPKYNKRTKQGHIKTVWCYKCKRKTVQVQISKGG